LPIAQLVQHALGELKKLDYSRRTLRRYRTVWKHLVAFAVQQQLGDQYSEQLTARFVDMHQVPTGTRLTAETGWRRHVAFSVKVLGDFVRDRRIERPFTLVADLEIPVSMKKSLASYEQFCRERRHLRPSSLKERIRTIAMFVSHLGSKNLSALEQIQPEDISSFLTSRGRQHPRSASRGISDLRCFLRYLLEQRIVHRDLTQSLPTVRVPRDSSIPSVWDPELIGKLLKVIDRTSPRGKRDYAIVLLAYRLGLRLGDIRSLKLDDLKWDRATIEIRQSKTTAPLCLPMSEEIGSALIDYLKLGRPGASYREVFLTARLPFTPIPESNHLTHVMAYWRELAGIRFRTRQHGGLHSLRHTLATQLLQQGTPLHVISDILGHTSAESTMIYAKADVESLRGAALDPEEVRHGQ
jgi:site-specific recombinase XerD